MAFNEVNLIVECAAGTRSPLVLRNLGWSDEESGYVTEFESQGVLYRSLFKTEKYVQEHCSVPALRLACDENFLYDELGLLVVEPDELVTV
jgi:hypothetical protein